MTNLHLMPSTRNILSYLLPLLLSFSLSAQNVSSWICDFMAPSNEALKLDGQLLANEAEVAALYDSLSCSPLWYSETSLLDHCYGLLEEIEASKWDGLDPEDYNYSSLKERVQDLDKVSLRLFLVPAEELATMDILLTDAALKLGKDLRVGTTNPVELGLMWQIPLDSIFIVEEFLESMDYLSADASAVDFIPAMRPDYPQYLALRDAYQRLEKEPKDSLDLNLPDDILIRPGDTGIAVLAIRQKLDQLYGVDSIQNNFLDTVKVDTVSFLEDSVGIDLVRSPKYSDEICIDTFAVGDSIYILIDTFEVRMDEVEVRYDTIEVSRDSLLVELDTLFRDDFYDSLLVKRVKQYQDDNSLNADGVVGPKTLRRMTFSKSQKLDEMLINLETWKWMPRTNYERQILVNIAGFYLDVMEYDSIVHKKKVMVGTIRTRTPVFTELMEYLEFNPYWNVTYNIASREMLPSIKRNPGYLAANNYELFSGGKKVNPHSVDWSTVSRRNFNYRIRQKPGKRNALGLVKFMFPNEYSVYLHDTPSKPKFALASRALSHGCVRLQNPLQLAEYLLSDQEKWDMDKIDNVISRGKNKRVSLDKPVPITLHYQTVFVDENGVTHYMEDVYKRNGVVKEALGL